MQGAQGRPANQTRHRISELETAPLNLEPVPKHIGWAVDEHTGELYREQPNFGDAFIERDNRNTEERCQLGVTPFKQTDLYYEMARICGCCNPECPNAFNKEQKKTKKHVPAANTSTAAAAATDDSGIHTSGVELVPVSCLLATLTQCYIKSFGAQGHEHEAFSGAFQQAVHHAWRIVVNSQSGAFGDMLVDPALDKHQRRRDLPAISITDMVCCHSKGCIKHVMSNLMLRFGISAEGITEDTLLSGILTEETRVKALSLNRWFWKLWDVGNKPTAVRREVYDKLIEIHAHSLFHTQKMRNRVTEIQTFVGCLQASSHKFPGCPEYLKTGVSFEDYQRLAVRTTYAGCVLFVRDEAFNLNIEKPWHDKCPGAGETRKFLGYNVNFSTLAGQIAEYMGHACNDAYLLMVYLYWENQNLRRLGEDQAFDATGYPKLTVWGEEGVAFFEPRRVAQHMCQDYPEESVMGYGPSKSVYDLVDRKNLLYSTERVGGSLVPYKIAKECRSALRAAQPVHRVAYCPRIPPRCIKFVQEDPRTNDKNKHVEERNCTQCRMATATMARILYATRDTPEDFAAIDPLLPPEDYTLVRNALWQRAHRVAFLTIRPPKTFQHATINQRIPQMYGYTGFWPTDASDITCGLPIDRSRIKILPPELPRYVQNNRTRLKAHLASKEMPFVPLNKRKRAKDDANYALLTALRDRYTGEDCPSEALGVGTLLPLECIVEDPVVQAEAVELAKDARLTQRVDFDAIRRSWSKMPVPNAAIVSAHGTSDDADLMQELGAAKAELTELLRDYEDCFPEGDSDDDVAVRVRILDCIESVLTVMDRMSNEWRTMHNDEVAPWFDPPASFRAPLQSYYEAEDRVRRPLRYIDQTLLQLLRMAKKPRSDPASLDVQTPIGKHLADATMARTCASILRTIHDRETGNAEREAKKLEFQAIAEDEAAKRDLKGHKYTDYVQARVADCLIKHRSLTMNHLAARRLVPANVRITKSANKAAALDAVEEQEADYDEPEEMDAEESANEPADADAVVSDGLVTDELLVGQVYREQQEQFLAAFAETEFARLQKNGKYGNATPAEQRRFETNVMDPTRAFFADKEASDLNHGAFVAVHKEFKSAGDLNSVTDHAGRIALARKLFDHMIRKVMPHYANSARLRKARSEE